MNPVPFPNPAARIEAAFRIIHAGRMRGLPLLNPALRVEAVGFRPWELHWLGVLITPWFMNLMLMPREPGKLRAVAAGDAVAYRFPSGTFEFLSGHDDALGEYQTCSLFSPMFQFTDQEAARLTALAALRSLFDAAALDQSTGAGPGSIREAVMSKREFLLGGRIPESHESAHESGR
jgi:[NiFe] hydrogenase assembly HybE family chaperone